MSVNKLNPSKSGIPSGNTAARPSSPATGDTFYDGTLGFLLIWDGTKWLPCSAPAAQPTIAITDVGTGIAYGTLQGSVAFTEGSSGGKAAGFTATQGTVSSTATSSPIVLTITGNPGSYSFTGTAYNGFGTSPSAPNVSQTLTSVPDVPTIGTASNAAIGGAIKVAFTAGATGGKSITNYKYSIDGGTTYTAFSPAQTTSPLTISGLTNGTSYTVRIKAVNANGDSVASSASNSVIPTLGLTVNYLVVAGGAGGGTTEGGGGGGGGLRSTVTASGRGTSPESALTLTPGTNYTVTVGAGGAGNTNQGAGGDGSNSVFSTITSNGGGGGAQGASGASEIGRDGGCGGGGGSSGGNNSKVGGAGTTAQGYNGGTGGNNDKGAGGGGGTGSVGADGSSSVFIGGNGGLGTSVSITGTSVSYSGGGGGGIFNNGTGGSGFGGGGSASGSASGNGGSGTANTGGGGAGGNYSSGDGGNGGSGVVILRWLTADGSITVGAGLTADATQTDGSFSYKRFTAGTGTVNF